MKFFSTASLSLLASVSEWNSCSAFDERRYEDIEEGKHTSIRFRRNIKRDPGFNLVDPTPSPGQIPELWRRLGAAYIWQQTEGMDPSFFNLLAEQRVVPDISDPFTAQAADVVATVVAPSACDESTPAAQGLGINGVHTERYCAILKAWIDFWSLDLATLGSALQATVLKGTKSQILQDTSIVAQVTGVPQQSVQGLQTIIQNFLPGGFDSPLLSLGRAGAGYLHADGNVYEAYPIQDQPGFFERNQLPSLTYNLGDGYLKYITDFRQVLNRGGVEYRMLDALGRQLTSIVEPVPTPVPGQALNRTEISALYFSMRYAGNILIGYFLGHKKTDAPFDTSSCAWLKLIYDFGQDRVCSAIIGLKMATEDGDNVNATRAVEFGLNELNREKIDNLDPAVCPTPPGCNIYDFPLPDFY